MFVLDNLGREIQEANSLCWAAVATMAVRAFPEEGKFRHPTQRQTVIYRESDIATVAQLVEAERAGGVNHDKFAGFTASCKDRGSCNFPSVKLHMFDIESDRVPPGRALTPEHFRIELGVRRRPVPIRWHFKGEITIDGRTRKGDHALLVTGFNENTHEVRVFDPGPSLDPGEAPEPAAHEKWLPFSAYLDPESDHGLDAFAKHEFDEFRLRRVGRDQDLAALEYPEAQQIPLRIVRRENSVDLSSRIPDGLHAAIGKFMRAHVVRNSGGDVIHGPYDAGVPIPVIPLHVAQIVAAVREPSALFKPDTSTVAVPVLRNGVMIDSFLMLHDTTGWHPRGYCNNRIASLLLQAREILGERPGERRFYLVSIPELSLFFVAHGHFDQANIAGLNRGCVNNLRSCRAAIPDLISKVQREGLDLQALRRSLGSTRA